MKIAIEGLDFTGKSTQVKRLKCKGFSTIIEPGNTKSGKEIRRIVLHDDTIAPMSRFMLFMADRINTHHHINKWLNTELNHIDYFKKHFLKKPIDTFIMDRSIVTSVGYAVASGLSMKNIIDVASLFGETFPDFVIFINISGYNYRMRSGRVVKDILEDVEDKEILKRKTSMYEACIELKIPYCCVNGNASEESVEEEILKLIKDFKDGKKPWIS